jgi:hypothetical protein
MLAGEERREFQRLAVNPPIAATLGGLDVSLTEVGVLGARVRHARELPKSVVELRFAGGEGEVTMRCEVVRTNDGDGATSESGIRFVAAIGDSGDRLRAILARLANDALQSRRDAGALPLGYGVDGDKTIRGKDASYICYRIDNGVWRKRAVFLPEQPPAGFTVARGLDDDEIQRLQRVYQASDDEGRRLIRIFAELSVSEALEIPPRA